MKNMINIRNSVIIILCITIICMAMGFIIISVNYTKKSKDISYSVVFTDIKQLSSVKGSDKSPNGKTKINNTKSEIEMNITMNAPHDELSYLATIENKGNIDIEILDIMESPDYKLSSFKNIINPVSINITDLKGRVLKPKEKINLKVVFYYNSGNKGIKTFDYKLGLITKSK